MTSSNAVWTEPRSLMMSDGRPTHGNSNGKYGTRYRSRDALSATDPTEINHEHVFSRTWLIEQMIAEPDQHRAPVETQSRRSQNRRARAGP